MVMVIFFFQPVSLLSLHTSIKCFITVRICTAEKKNILKWAILVWYILILSSLALISLWPFVNAASDTFQKFQRMILYLWKGTFRFWGILANQWKPTLLEVDSSGVGPRLQFPQSCVCELHDQAGSHCVEQSVEKDPTQALCQQVAWVFLLDIRDAENKHFLGFCLVVEMIVTEI